MNDLLSESSINIDELPPFRNNSLYKKKKTTILLMWTYEVYGITTQMSHKLHTWIWNSIMITILDLPLPLLFWIRCLLLALFLCFVLHWMRKSHHSINLYSMCFLNGLQRISNDLMIVFVPWLESSTVWKVFLCFFFSVESCPTQKSDPFKI